MAILNQIEADEMSKLKFLGKTANKTETFSLNQLFHLQGEKTKFYQNAKEKHLDETQLE